jgi:glycine cleavage system H protein
MSNIPTDLLFARSHEWVRDNGDGTVTIGITDHAQDQLGDMVFIETPEVGRRVEAGEAFAVVESVKAASDVYSPVAGEVIDTNGALTDTPERVNDSPYDEGWIAKLKVDDDPSGLMDAKDYGEYLAAEE